VAAASSSQHGGHHHEGERQFRVNLPDGQVHNKKRQNFIESGFFVIKINFVVGTIIFD
jgi:hypothetical protein